MSEEDDIKKKFDYETFIKDLTLQAEAIIPEDISSDNKKYVNQMIYNFCTLACEAAVKDENITHDNTLLVTQFIGEWTFHKAIDLTRAGIEGNTRDDVLEQIAFVVYEISKQALLKEMSQTQVIQIIEHHVNKKYEEEINKLCSEEIITEEEKNFALKQSNIDKMEQEREPVEIEETSENKAMNLAAAALILKKMSPKKQTSILAEMPERDAHLVKAYLNMDDLSSNVNDVIKHLYETDDKKPVPQETVKPEKTFSERLINVIMYISIGLIILLVSCIFLGIMNSINKDILNEFFIIPFGFFGTIVIIALIITLIITVFNKIKSIIIKKLNKQKVEKNTTNKLNKIFNKKFINIFSYFSIIAIIFYTIFIILIIIAISKGITVNKYLIRHIFSSFFGWIMMALFCTEIKNITKLFDREKQKFQEENEKLIHTINKKQQLQEENEKLRKKLEVKKTKRKSASRKTKEKSDKITKSSKKKTKKKDDSKN